MLGVRPTDQGDCTRFGVASIPHCCRKDPAVVDLMPSVTPALQVPKCCCCGPISSWLHGYGRCIRFAYNYGRLVREKRPDCEAAEKLHTPCPWSRVHSWDREEGSAHEVPPHPTEDEPTSQALMTWNVTCTYSQSFVSKARACCVSLLAFPSSMIIGCPTCCCGCRSDATGPRSCVEADLAPVTQRPAGRDLSSPLFRGTDHTCPIRVHWHVELDYKKYWRVKITIANFDYRSNYGEWSLVVQCPNFDDLAQIFSFNSRPISPNAGFIGSAMVLGVKHCNDLLTQAGPFGTGGWTFPRRVSFNDDYYVMPPPEAYPMLPNNGLRLAISTTRLVAMSLANIFVLSRS